MRPHLITIVGATATGKTTLSIALAQHLGGEIINGDSRQIYRGMDIGTAKPTAAERAAAPHHLIDIIDPDAGFTLAAFLDAARVAVEDVWARGGQPIVVGGTGQYVWALLEGWQVPRVPPDRALRAELEARAERDGVESVAAILREIDPASADVIDPRNVRRMIRAIEVTRATGRPFSAYQQKAPPAWRTTLLGLGMPRPELHARTDARVDAMIAAGLVDEVRRLNAAGFGCELRSMASIGYREICAHLAGAISLEEAVAQMKTETHRLARMQHTWFRDDDERIAWLDARSPTLVDDALAVVRAPAGASDG
jgi:tRNA dimethylallyltransferase